jgi:hypothetical protein
MQAEDGRRLLAEDRLDELGWMDGWMDSGVVWRSEISITSTTD